MKLSKVLIIGLGRGSLTDVGQPTPTECTGQSAQRHFRLWHPGFYDFNIYTEKKLLEKLDYMHGNPVKAGIVSAPADYRRSSYRGYFKGGSHN